MPESGDLGHWFCPVPYSNECRSAGGKYTAGYDHHHSAVRDRWCGITLKYRNKSGYKEEKSPCLYVVHRHGDFCCYILV